MLTIKHIRFDGAETIDHCDRVIFYPDTNLTRGPDAPKQPNQPGTLTAVGAISGGVDWRSGIVYIMNETGATIARYDLGNHASIDHLGTSTSA